MNHTIYATTLALAIFIWAIPATAIADVCSDISAGGTVKLARISQTDGCTAKLTKDTTIEGSGKSTIIAKKHGVKILLNGHKLVMNGVKIDYSGDFALAVHGTDANNESVTFNGVVLNDTAPGDCRIAKDRFGVILWKVKNGTLNMTANNGKVRHGLLVGGPPSKPPVDPKNYPVIVVRGAIAHCSGLWPYRDQAILASQRRVSWGSAAVQSVGPDDFPAP